MQVGRFVFGIGGESLAVAQNTYAVAWFKGKELNMVFGFQLSVARVGSTVNFLTVGPLYHKLEELIGWRSERWPLDGRYSSLDQPASCLSFVHW